MKQEKRPLAVPADSYSIVKQVTSLLRQYRIEVVLIKFSFDRASARLTLKLIRGYQSKARKLIQR